MSKVRMKRRFIDQNLRCNPEGQLATYRGCNPFYSGCTSVILRGDGNSHPMHVAGVHFGDDNGRIISYMTEMRRTDIVVVPIRAAMKKYNFMPVGGQPVPPHEPYHLYATDG